jgi:hypothetical protein
VAQQGAAVDAGGEGVGAVDGGLEQRGRAAQRRQQRAAGAELDARLVGPVAVGEGLEVRPQPGRGQAEDAAMELGRHPEPAREGRAEQLVEDVDPVERALEEQRRQIEALERHARDA